MTPDRRTLLALFAIVFGLRVLYASLVGTDPAINPSPGTYDYFLAERLHDNIEWVSQPFTPRAPGYPLMLAAAFRVLGVRQWVAILLQAFLGGVTALMLYRIGERHLGRGVGLLSAIWLGLSIHQIHFASIFVRDILVTFMLVWFVFTMVRRFERMRQAIWAGVVFSLLVHVDPQFLLLLPVVLVYFVLFATRHRILNVQYMFLFAAAVFAVTLPWTIRNTLVYGEVVPVGLEAQRYIRPVAALATPGGDTHGEIMKSVRVMRAHPGGVWQNTFEFWRVTRFAASGNDGGETGTAGALHAESAWSLRHNLINMATFGVLLPLALVGLITALRRRNRAALVLFLVISTRWITYAVVGATERSRLPIEPFVILLAFYGLLQLVAAVRSPRVGHDSAPLGS